MAAVNAVLVGAGEYTTGVVHGSASISDKKIGVIGLCMFDLRRRGLVDGISIVDVSGKKWCRVREHFKENIEGKYADMDTTFDAFPEDSVARDAKSYIAAIEKAPKGSVVTIFTPDDTHFDIALAAIQKGLHVLVAKPAVKKLSDHHKLVQAAKENNVLIAVEFHKRWDPCYADAKQRIATLGDFSFFQSYMSQPKFQLETFQRWAGKSSDISYYLNSHHIDMHNWAVGKFARPIRVTASTSTGIAKELVKRDCDDTITLMVEWENMKSKNKGHAVYTSSWVAGRADVHSQQRFHYMGHQGEIQVDQAHRGYITCGDQPGSLASVNPLYMRYTPDAHGRFAGQNGYGYKSIEEFVLAASLINQGKAKPEDFHEDLACLDQVHATTVILEAGRVSLDDGCRPYVITYPDETSTVPIEIKPAF